MKITSWIFKETKCLFVWKQSLPCMSIKFYDALKKLKYFVEFVWFLFSFLVDMFLLINTKILHCFHSISCFQTVIKEIGNGEIVTRKMLSPFFPSQTFKSINYSKKMLHFCIHLRKHINLKLSRKLIKHQPKVPSIRSQNLFLWCLHMRCWKFKILT